MNLSCTPLRYPGGKQKIAPFISEIIQNNNIVGIDYIEPYAGGAGVAINLLLSNMVRKIHLNDSCFFVYSFWKTLLEDSEWFCKKVLLSSLTIEEWKKQREILRHKDDYSMAEVGFATFYLNRCNRSGILGGGIIGGLKQEGTWKMDARFSRKLLIQRIEKIIQKKDSIKVTNFDAEYLLENISQRKKKKSFVYCDPPYLRKAEKLYLNYYNHEDHERISKMIQIITNNYWVVSYDYSGFINNLYKSRKKFVYNLQYNASKVYLGKELFIFSDSLSIPSASIIKRINDVLKVQSA